MKRIGNIWNQVLDINNGVRAVVEGVRYKRKQRCVKKLLNDDRSVNAEAAKEYVKPLIEKLRDGTWKHKPPRMRRQFCRSSKGGKWRNLYIPSLDDHIVAHMLI